MLFYNLDFGFLAILNDFRFDFRQAIIMRKKKDRFFWITIIDFSRFAFNYNGQTITDLVNIDH